MKFYVTFVFQDKNILMKSRKYYHKTRHFGMRIIVNSEGNGEADLKLKKSPLSCPYMSKTDI